ncbi:MAG TPA: chromate transporter, partial [Kiritimatiellia bacterium]|nr:chromate transporter [Kiritimatiellia bacterium]
MNLLLKLASVFFKIGLLTVGGGLAMIPIVQQEMVGRGWLTNRQFLDILGIAQMTP